MRRPAYQWRCPLAWALLASGDALSDSEPVGYTELLTTHSDLVPETCAPVAGFPAYVRGTMLIPSLGQLEMGDEQFTGLLDGFGKLQRFTIGDGRVCFAARMLASGFYNDSIARGKIAPGLLFMETKPPRGYIGPENMAGANDNVFVNSYVMAGRYRLITDSQISLEMDPLSLGVVGKLKWQDSLDRAVLPLGSAHPLPDPSGGAGGEYDGCLINVHPQNGIRHTETLLFRICPDRPSTRVQLNSYISDWLPYFHSWGLSRRHAVLPIMHFTIDLSSALLKGETMSKAFTPEGAGVNTTTVAVLPLDGGAPTEFYVPAVVFYTHVINTYENASAIVMDVIAWRANPFAGAAVLASYRNQSQRNAMPDENSGVPTRVVLTLQGADKGKASVSPLPGTPSGYNTTTDFPVINPRFNSRPYCLFYAVQWNCNGDSYARMAIVKVDVCGGGRGGRWLAESAFPSEPRFLPDPAGVNEDDGTLLFTVLDGTSTKTSLVAVDARTMKTIGSSQQVYPVGFTTHGQWYPGLG